jgi:DHA1 family tetracycline resistance protein-like MFS transporter
MLVLASVILMSAMGFGLILPSFLFYAENLGASAFTATLIVASYSLGQFVGTPIWGKLSDRYGRKPVLIISMIGGIISYSFLAFSWNLWVLGLARVFGGLMAGNFSAAAAYVADITPPEKRTQGMGYVGASMSVGFMLGPALGGLLGGADAESASLLWPGLVAVVTSVITLIAIIFFLPESRTKAHREEAEAQQSAGGGNNTRDAFRRPEIVEFLLLGLLAFLVMSNFETIFPLWAGERFDWGPREVGFSFTYLGLLVAVVQGGIVGKVVPRYGEIKIITVTLVLYCIGLISMTMAPDWRWMMVGITATAVGGGAFNTTMVSLVSKVAGEHERGLVIGLYQSASWFGRTAGPPMSGALFTSVGVNAPLLLAAGLIAPCLLLVALISKRAH